MNSRHRNILLAVVLVTAFSATLHAGIINLPPGLLNYVLSKWGAQGQQRVLGLPLMEQQQAALAHEEADVSKRELNWLSADNAFWNRIPYFSDLEHWGIEDYWATPIEMLASNGGDCEDYSIGKYFTLKDLGVPIQKLRIVYVRAIKLNISHMVLAYYPEPDADPLILDNLRSEILPASRRNDLIPIYSFNDEDLWLEGESPSKSSKSGKSSQIRLWHDLLEKMDKEQKL